MRVPPIVSARMDLVSMSAEFMRASLDGDRSTAAALLGAELPRDWPDAGNARTLRRRLRQLDDDASQQPWLVRAMIPRAAPRRMVARVGFHAPPDAAGAVEIGYAVEPEFRRRGYAEEAVRAMLEWAAREHAVTRCVASVSPTNLASLALVAKLGFVQIGDQWDDEDGLELVFSLALA